MLTPAGTAIFRSYVTGLVWLQSWGPLYAVLHRISMGGSGGAHAGRRADARWRYRHLAGGASGDTRGGLGRGRDERVSVHVGALPRRRARLRALQGHGAGHLGARRRPGRGERCGARGHDGQSLACQHRLRHAPLRHPGGPPDQDLRACRHRPLHRLRADGRGDDGDGGRHRGRRCGRRDQPDTGGRGSIIGVARDLPRDPRRRGPDALAPLVGGRRARRATRPLPTRRPLVERYSHDVSTGEAYARGVTESESSQAQQLDSPCGEAGRDRRTDQEPGDEPDGRGEGRRWLGQDFQARRQRRGHVARPDHRVRTPGTGCRNTTASTA